MYYQKFYPQLNEQFIIADGLKAGFTLTKLIDPANLVYTEHIHPETKLIVVLNGNIEITVAGKKYNCMSGDKIIVEANVIHSALVGENGCTFFWSEKLI